MVQQLNPDKSEVLAIGTTQQLHATSSAVSVAGVDLPTADKMKVLGVVLDRRLAFNNHVTAETRSCNYHAQVIRHIRHLLTTELAQTLPCSLILSRIDYCNAVLPAASTCAEQCRSGRPSAAKAITHQVTTPPAALAAGQTADHIQ